MITLEKLYASINACQRCGLHKTRINSVPGDGNINSKIMVIGEAPGEQEDLQGLPFVGKAGKLLDKMLLSIDLDRSNVYICNILKCRPPNNRNPENSEAEQCLDYLRHQFVIMRPKLIILLGSVACKQLIDQNFSIMKRHGEVIERKGVIFVPTFHPSALLRDENKKKLAWSDLKTAKKIIDELKLI